MIPKIGVGNNNWPSDEISEQKQKEKKNKEYRIIFKEIQTI